MIKRALISLSDKSGIVDFARELVQFSVEIISTGGTAKTLREAGLKVTDVSDYTGFPEIMDGRVKTLHPKVHGGLLARRDNPSHMETLKRHHIETIDMVVVNLYPFEATVAKVGVTFEEAIENIDIGGPTMLRSAAKNFEGVVVIVDPQDYPIVIETMKRQNGDIDRSLRLRLAQKVFERTSQYDLAISNYLSSRLQGV
jgi:phosphoribosylaminoimidazolecarboxamide formyltransferase/IMP cyclohydrolase